MNTPEIVISVVMPCFNEAPNVEAICQRIETTLLVLGEPFEIVCVNDGSTDDTAEILERLAAAHPHLRVLHFSRNFGHMAALTAGLEHARGTGAVISMDSDGQHPPELIAEMVRLWREGAEIVQTVRLDAEQNISVAKRRFSRLYYRVLNLLADVELPIGAADFRLLDRQVVDAINRLPERDRFVRALVHWVGFRRALLPYAPQDRLAGYSKYSWGKMLRLGLSGITGFSTRPLRLAFLVGALVTACAFLYAGYILLCYFRGIPLVPGWTSMLLALLLLSGIQLLTLGIASEYLARLFHEQKQRPVYILRIPRTADSEQPSPERHDAKT